VPSLSLPSTAALTVTAARTYPAVELFVDRARAVAFEFALTESRLVAVVDICRRLDGIPLAIELAAARLATLGLADLRTNLSHRFTLLSIGPRDLAPRQQTLLATIDWSYDLLDENERMLLRSLSVFAGTFTLAAASATCGQVAAIDGVVALLSSLVDKSLLSADSDGDEVRYSMLESMREYVRTRLSSGEADALVRRYVEWAASVADECERTRYTTSWDIWLRRATRDADNMSAVAWSLEHDAVSAGRIVAGLRGYWISIGRLEDLCRLSAQLLEVIHADTHPWIIARLHLCMHNVLADDEKLRAIDSARGLFAAIGDQQGLAISHLYLSSALGARDPAAALDAADLAQRFANEARMPRLLPHIALLRASIRLWQRRLPEARLLARQAIREFTALDETALAMSAERFLFQLEFDMGNTDDAADLAGHLENRVKTLEEVVDNRERAGLLLTLAAYRSAVGDLESALSSARSVLLDPRLHWQTHIVGAIECIATIAVRGEDYSTAARLYGFTNGRQIVDDSRGLGRFSRDASRRIIESELRSHLATDELSFFLADGARLSLDEAVAQALRYRGDRDSVGVADRGGEEPNATLRLVDEGLEQ